ncbi:hypothetical protein MPL1032_180173 [Mesorhizobium plurifarium]|uniref:Uncharacterized protein n=1 Tax=Mesorhizobium plurifarium TaxID=69974 RepID=A0A0K2VTN7_MESPL|nr:hypothetical protein MPL1032_180173 [Mesorhizobium plurifarium]
MRSPLKIGRRNQLGGEMTLIWISQTPQKPSAAGVLCGIYAVALRRFNRGLPQRGRGPARAGPRRLAGGGSRIGRRLFSAAKRMDIDSRFLDLDLIARSGPA